MITDHIRIFNKYLSPFVEGIQLFPVEPKPPAPRSVPLSASDSTISGSSTGAITICATRSSGAIT